MAYTALNVVNMAVLRSALNDQNLFDTFDPGLKAISSYERQIYIRAARLNPEFFGDTANTAARLAWTDPWDLSATPGKVAAVTRARVQALTGIVTPVVGDQVNLVTLRYPSAEIAPRAYIRNRKIYAYQTELGTNSSNMVTQLQIDYALMPNPITSINQTMTIPDDWVDLVVLPIAKLMALRDRRPDDAAAIDAEFKDLLNLFDQEVLVFDQGVSRPLESVPTLPIGPNA